MRGFIKIVFLSIVLINTAYAQKNADIVSNTKLEFPTYKTYNCSEIEEANITIFCISFDDTFTSLGTKPTKYEQELLEMFLKVFPRKMRERVVEVEFEARDVSEGSAAITGIDIDNSLWTIWINTDPEASSDKTEIMQSIAHELMHYLTLNITQTTTYTDDCLGMEKVLANCQKKNTLLYSYIKQFWLPIFNKKIWPKGNYNRYYDKHPDDFVTPYAVTDPAEDIAETFIEFIFTDKPIDLSLIKNQKINFFWNFDEYISLRTEIREQF